MTNEQTLPIAAMLEKYYDSFLFGNSYDDRVWSTWNDIHLDVKELEEAQQQKMRDKIEEEYMSIQELVSKVYCHLTNGQISKWNTDSSVVISIVENISNESAKEEERERIVEMIKEYFAEKKVHIGGKGYFIHDFRFREMVDLISSNQ